MVYSATIMHVYILCLYTNYNVLYILCFLDCTAPYAVYHVKFSNMSRVVYYIVFCQCMHKILYFVKGYITPAQCFLRITFNIYILNLCVTKGISHHHQSPFHSTELDNYQLVAASKCECMQWFSYSRLH